MAVRPLTISLWATGAGAAEAMTRSASLVRSAAALMTSAGVRSSSSPSSELSQRFTFATISAWVSPSNERVAMARGYRRSGPDPADREHRETERQRDAAQDGALGAGGAGEHGGAPAVAPVE